MKNADIFKIPYIFYPLHILQLADQSANKKTTISLIASMRFFYHRYLIIVSCNSVSLGVLSILVLRLMLPVLPTHRDPKVKEEGLVPSGSGRIRARGMMGSEEEGKLDRRMPRSSNCVTLKSYRHKQTNNNNEKHKVKSSGYSSLCGCFIEYFDICWREVEASSIECTVRTR